MNTASFFDDTLNQQSGSSGSHALRWNPSDPRCGLVARLAKTAIPLCARESEYQRDRIASSVGIIALLPLLILIAPTLSHAATSVGATPVIIGQVPGMPSQATTAVGATPGSFKVSETGAATYSIPITVPPGTAGMTPSLSLNYNSQSGNGPLGVGWSLGGLSAITRCPASIAQDGFKGGINYDGNDRYCLDGQRLVAVSGAYGANGTEYRTETESYTRVISYGTAGNGPAWFKAWTKSGQIIEYGNTADSRIEAQAKPTVRVWGVNKISDTKTNYIAVAYTEDNANGEFYVSRIDYTGNDAAGVAPYASVQFGYEVRQDASIAYEMGSIIKSTKRIINIKTYNIAVNNRLFGNLNGKKLAQYKQMVAKPGNAIF